MPFSMAPRAAGGAAGSAEPRRRAVAAVHGPSGARAAAARALPARQRLVLPRSPSRVLGEERAHELAVLLGLEAARRPHQPPAGAHARGGLAQEPRLQLGERGARRGPKRQRADGRCASTPVLLHGASTSTASNAPGGRPPCRRRRALDRARRGTGARASRAGAPMRFVAGRRRARWRPTRQDGGLAAGRGAQIEHALAGARLDELGRARAPSRPARWRAAPRSVAREHTPRCARGGEQHRRVRRRAGLEGHEPRPAPRERVALARTARTESGGSSSSDPRELERRLARRSACPALEERGRHRQRVLGPQQRVLGRVAEDGCGRSAGRAPTRSRRGSPRGPRRRAQRVAQDGVDVARAARARASVRGAHGLRHRGVRGHAGP